MFVATPTVSNSKMDATASGRGGSRSQLNSNKREAPRGKPVASSIFCANRKALPQKSDVRLGHGQYRSDSDLVTDQHAVFPIDVDSSSLTRSLSLPVLNVSNINFRF